MIRLLLFLRRHVWPIAFVIFVGIVAILGSLLYWFPIRGAKAQTYSLERRLKEQQIERESLHKLYKTLEGKYRKLESDRNNVLTQTKQLLQEKESYVATEAQFKTLSEENQKLLDDHKKLEGSFAAIQTKAKELEDSLGSALSEKKAREEEVARIQQEKQALAHAQAESEGKVRSLTEAVDRYKGFKESFVSLSETYETLKKERQFLEKKLENLPKKFTKMARENEILRQETGDMHYNLGVFYAGEMNYDRALEEFKKAAEINPNDAKALYNLGYIYAEQRQNRKKAEYYFRLFLELAPTDPNVHEVKSYLLEQDVFTTNVLKS